MAVNVPHAGAAAVDSTPNAKIIDIRQDREEVSLTEEIHKGLHVAPGQQKSLPTLLLYDEKGLKLFEEITYLDEYYLTNAEIEVLRHHAHEIAQHIVPGSMIIELGSGNLRKVNILLEAIDNLGKAVEYYALDLSLNELERTLSGQSTKFTHVTCAGLWGTYDDGLIWLKSAEVASKRKTILSLGSSVGNFSKEDAALFIKSFADVLDPRDTLLLGIDSCCDAQRVQTAYNDSIGVTYRFDLNGLEHANQVLGYEAFNVGEWEAFGQYDPKTRRHEAFVAPLKECRILDVVISRGERIKFEESHKYTSVDLAQLWSRAGVEVRNAWSNSRSDYTMHLVSQTNYQMPLRATEYAADSVPSLEQYEQLWQLWDTVTRGMISDEELYEKPIKLRNACIFYLGHIPAFLDIKLTAILKEAPTEPAYFHKIFERGIDPDVDNPEKCHAHSEIPDSWPPLDDILGYQHRVRDRVRKQYQTGATLDMQLGRCLWLGYEHEAMHLETLLYMLIQSEKTKKPPGLSTPDFVALAEQANKMSVPNEWIDIPAQTVSLNMDDPESNDNNNRYFGWDSEKPQRVAHVPAFVAKSRPISVGEYAHFLESTNRHDVPASWKVDTDVKSVVNGGINGFQSNDSSDYNHPSPSFLNDKYIRTVFGLVPLKLALHWPASASFEELERCAAYMGGRIPTLEEARSIYNFAEQTSLSKHKAASALGQQIPAVNSHLVNEGVEETPPKVPVTTNGETNGVKDAAQIDSALGQKLDPYSLFIDLSTDCNVGFQSWHPVAITSKGNRICGQAEMGGVWEWTSSVLEPHDGYEPMYMYPNFSRDFFDGKHNIVLGGSWATIPRLAGRKSFVNWYQHNYAYAWAGARLVKDKA